jgi:two-component system C4-dicarboxylate transport response regulator DctD
MNDDGAGTVVFVDDDPDVRSANVQALRIAGLRVHACAGGAEALRIVERDIGGVVVSDIRMPRLDGRQLLGRLRAIDEEIPVILITGHADVAQAVDAMREGAYDFVAKPYPTEQLLNSVRRALTLRSLVLDNRRLRAAVSGAEHDLPLLGASPAMVTLRATVQQIAGADVDVLIEGETGAGKEVVARALRERGRRRSGPFIAINCAALPEATIESDLFGHEAGAFPGAVRRRPGWIESAHRGTLFLDNVDSAPPALQARLLRVLEERQIVPVGGSLVRSVDFRAVAAANGDLGQLVAEGRFRGDLFYRLNVVRIRIPPLRERRADIPLLFGHFLAAAARRFQREAPLLSEGVRRHLLEHDWPGNVRELQHFAERVALGFETGTRVADEAGHASLPQRVDRYEASLIREALAATGGDVRSTIAVLRIPRKTFYDKLARYDIRIDDYRGAVKAPGARRE